MLSKKILNFAKLNSKNSESSLVNDIIEKVAFHTISKSISVLEMYDYRNSNIEYTGDEKLEIVKKKMSLDPQMDDTLFKELFRENYGYFHFYLENDEFNRSYNRMDIPAGDDFKRNVEMYREVETKIPALIKEY